MPIGLNYSQFYYTEGNLLLPNYVYLLDNEENISLEDDRHILHHVHDGKLLDMFKDPANDTAFDDPLIRKLLLEAYPYEVQMKFAGQDITNDHKRNEKIISLFNEFFHIDYHAELKKYSQERNSDALQQSFSQHRENRYDNITVATQQFLDFCCALFAAHGYEDECNALRTYAKENFDIVHNPGISGNTSADDDSIIVEVGNNTYTTLFHELVHAVNRFFRFEYYETGQVCADSYTKTNEGLSNFVAYHLMQQIIDHDIDGIESMELDPIFFSMYIDIYATMLEHGTNDRKKNFDIIYQELSRFEGDLLNDQKARFYYQRFYKFFHYDQHEYFYPKEMMYYLGYNQMLELFRNSDNKKQLLTQCLLGKVCL